MSARLVLVACRTVIFVDENFAYDGYLRNPEKKGETLFPWPRTSHSHESTRGLGRHLEQAAAARPVRVTTACGGQGDFSKGEGSVALWGRMWACEVNTQYGFNGFNGLWNVAEDVVILTLGVGYRRCL